MGFCIYLPSLLYPPFLLKLLFDMPCHAHFDDFLFFHYNTVPVGCRQNSFGLPASERLASSVVSFAVC